MFCMGEIDISFYLKKNLSLKREKSLFPIENQNNR